MEIDLAKLRMFRVQQEVSFAGRHRRNRERDRTLDAEATRRPVAASHSVLQLPALPNSPAIFSRSKSRARHLSGGSAEPSTYLIGGEHRTNAPESQERPMNGFRSCKPRGRLWNSSGHRCVLLPRHHTVDTMRDRAGKHASAEDAAFDSH
jgi:hypothetical protein